MGVRIRGVPLYNENLKYMGIMQDDLCHPYNNTNYTLL